MPEQTQERKATEQDQADPINVKSYVDDYMAGRGRDSAEHEQFAGNNAQEIEAEFQSRKAQQEQEPDIPYSDAPPLEPETTYYPEPSYHETHESERYRSEPEHNQDYEYGD